MKNEIKNIADYIADKNQYFDNWFVDAYVSKDDGAVFAETEKGVAGIFPNDGIGNYFFIMPSGNTSISSGVKMSDCHGKVINTNTGYNLVVVVRDADTDAVFSNILNSLSGYKGNGKISVNNAVLSTINAVTTLMRGSDTETLNRLFTRVKYEDILIVGFDVTESIKINANCIIDICQEC